VPVWASSGLRQLFDNLCFGGESAGASFLRQDGTVWVTDKDGPVVCLLAAEMRRGPKDRANTMIRSRLSWEPVYGLTPAPSGRKSKVSELSPETGRCGAAGEAPSPQG
jgi:phosphoglucomutase